MSATSLAPIVHEHHARLTRHVDQIPATGDLIGYAQPLELAFALEETCAFLTDLLVPHMDAAERAIYPELERLFQNRHSMTPMRKEHGDIRARVDAVIHFREQAEAGPLSLTQQVELRRTLFGLYALLKVHLAEEILYAELVEHGATVDEESALAAAMAHAGTATF